MKQFIKKSLFSCLLIAPLMVQAQTKNWWDGWLSIKQPVVYNAGIGPDGNPLKAGIIVVSQSFVTTNEATIPISDLPTDATYSMRLHDVYNVFDKNDQISDFSKFIRRLHENSDDADAGVASYDWQYSIFRGGEYKMEAESPAINIHKDTAMVIYDVPNLQMFGNTTCNVGKESSLYTTYRFNTGYPYSQDTLKAEENLHLKLYRVTKDGNVLIDEKNETFTLLDKEKPLLAGVYEYTYKPQVEELGAYLLEMQSSWNNLQKFTRFDINDTLRAEVTLDKEMYQKAIDKKAILNVKMDYDYPYVQKEKENEKPTIRVHYNLLGIKDNQRVSFLKDSLLIQDDALASEHINLEKDIELSLDEALATYAVQSEKDTLDLDVDIFFNGLTRFAKTLPLVVKNNSTGLNQVSAALATDGKTEYFNAQGQPVANPNAERGIIIKRRGGKVVKMSTK